MPLDYRERRQVNKNRPKNRPVKLIILFVAGAALCIYSLGVATGWFLNKAMKTRASDASPGVSADATPKSNDTPLPSGVQPQQRGNNNRNSYDPPLTFYYTLPKGEKSALGSGLNPVNRNMPSATGSKTSELEKARPLHPQGEQSRNNPASGQRPDVSGPVSTEAANKRYTVQVASCSVKKEAEDLKIALDKQGLLSHVVESNVPGKGIWYRVRLGNQLDLETANKIAAKVGKGAIVVPE
jgi:cell division protein FtsN